MSNFGFILAAYMFAALVLAGLVAWIVADGRKQNRRLKDLDAQGIRRRSAGKKGAA